jgi:integrase
MLAGHADVVAGAATAPVLDALAERVLDQMDDGTLRNRSGDPFKPSVVRSYESTYNQHIRPTLGSRRISTITRRDVQALVDEVMARGLSASTARNVLMPLRLVFRVAVRDEMGVTASPIHGVELPAVRGVRERYATPVEVRDLLGALEARDRGLWAMAFYAGLRRGELMGLRWGDVDLDAATIRVERAYDPGSKTYQTPKSRAGIRTVPIVKSLRVALLEHRMQSGRQAGLVFGRDKSLPFSSEAVSKRAARVWTAAHMQTITLHSCRHTFASLMIAAGVNAKTLQEIGGWSSIAIVYDRYGHLMPGARDEAAGLLEAYLEAALQ